MGSLLPERQNVRVSQQSVPRIIQGLRYWTKELTSLQCASYSFFSEATFVSDGRRLTIRFTAGPTRTEQANLEKGLDLLNQYACWWQQIFTLRCSPFSPSCRFSASRRSALKARYLLYDREHLWSFGSPALLLSKALIKAQRRKYRGQIKIGASRYLGLLESRSSACFDQADPDALAFLWRQISKLPDEQDREMENRSSSVGPVFMRPIPGFGGTGTLQAGPSITTIIDP